MAYLFKQRLDLLSLAPLDLEVKKVSVAVGDVYLSQLYQRHLSDRGFEVFLCRSVDAVHEHINIFRPHLLLLGLDGNERKFAIVPFLLKLKMTQPELFIVTVGNNVNSETLRKIMNAGASSHIERQYSRPQDI